MKKIFPVILLAGALLGGCSLLDKIPAESIRIEGQEYRTGSYENLYPANLSFTGKEYEVEGILYHQVESENFNMVQCDLGTVTTGTVYCEADQWEEAKAYYAEGENYRYFSEIGGGRTDRESETKTLETVDIQKFNALLAFAGENVYEPFRSNSNGQEVIMESPDPDKSPRVDFYKESKDGYFISDRAYHFYVVNEKLYFLRYFDRKEDTMHAVQVPEEIAGYFLELYRERLVKSE